MVAGHGFLNYLQGINMEIIRKSLYWILMKFVSPLKFRSEAEIMEDKAKRMYKEFIKRKGKS